MRLNIPLTCLALAGLAVCTWASFAGVSARVGWARTASSASAAHIESRDMSAPLVSDRAIAAQDAVQQGVKQEVTKSKPLNEGCEKLPENAGRYTRRVSLRSTISGGI